MEANVDGYSFHVYGDSDEGGISDSSEEQLDEVNVLLHGTPDQKRKVLKSLTGDEASSSDDDFEKIMDKELNKKMKTMEDEFLKLKNEKSLKKVNKAEQSTSSTNDKEFYDEIYFDSDDDNNEGSNGKQVPIKRKKFTDDELFYDPNADDEDEKWVAEHRNKLKVMQEKSNKVKPLPNSDAVLDCPSCMTTLCLDCQRHDLYKCQYRAMFVMNCNVDREELLHYKHPKKKKFKRHKNRNNSEDGPMSIDDFEKQSTTTTANEDETTYNPVKCSTCNTEVAVYDNDEVYHFFNVLASHS